MWSQGARRIVVLHSDASQNISELLELNASGKIVGAIPLRTPEGRALAFDRAGNLYVGEGMAIFKNGALLASLPNGGFLDRLAVDSGEHLYVTSTYNSELFRIDPLGHVILFADSTIGLNQPYGLAIDSMDHVFVASNPPSAPAFILKFEQSGTPLPFATDISFQPIILSMTFDWGG